MLRHVVMWTLKDENKQDNLLKMRDMLLGLKSKIEYIRDLEVGLDTLHGAASYDIVLTVTLDSRDDLPKYQNHPEHLKVGDFVHQVRKDRAVVDYEV